MADENVAEHFHARAGEVERLMCRWSVVRSLPVSLAEQPSAAIGAVIRPDIVRAVATEAGLAHIEVLRSMAGSSVSIDCVRGNGPDSCMRGLDASSSTGPIPRVSKHVPGISVLSSTIAQSAYCLASSMSKRVSPFTMTSLQPAPAGFGGSDPGSPGGSAKPSLRMWTDVGHLSTHTPMNR